MNIKSAQNVCRIALVTLICFFAAAAQTDESTKNEMSVWGGYSPDSTTLIKGSGRTPDARFGIVAVRYARRFNNNNAVNLRYTADVIPAAFLSFPDLKAVPVSGGTILVTTERKTTYGFGITPLGLQINLRPRKKIQPFIEGSGGFIYFDKQVPGNNLGTHFGFTANVGAGAEFRLKNDKSIQAGYKYYHISNGNRGVINPGFDNNLFYVGYTFKKF